MTPWPHHRARRRRLGTRRSPVTVRGACPRVDGVKQRYLATLTVLLALNFVLFVVQQR